MRIVPFTKITERNAIETADKNKNNNHNVKSAYLDLVVEMRQDLQKPFWVQLVIHPINVCDTPFCKAEGHGLTEKETYK
jgi:hypothetical protein